MKKTDSIAGKIFIVVLVIFSGSFIYNLLLFQIDTFIPDHSFCRFMTPSGFKSDCYLELAKKTGNMNYCDNINNIKKWQGCLSHIPSLDTRRCNDPRYPFHAGSCIRDVMEDAPAEISRGLDGGKYCNGSLETCIFDNISIQITNDSLQVHLWFKAPFSSNLTVTSNLCAKYLVEPLKPVICNHRIEQNHTFNTGVTHLQLNYDTIRDQYDLIAIKYIKIDLGSGKYIGTANLILNTVDPDTKCYDTAEVCKIRAALASGNVSLCNEINSSDVCFLRTSIRFNDTKLCSNIQNESLMKACESRHFEYHEITNEFCGLPPDLKRDKNFDTEWTNVTTKITRWINYTGCPNGNISNVSLHSKTICAKECKEFNSTFVTAGLTSRFADGENLVGYYYHCLCYPQTL